MRANPLATPNLDQAASMENTLRSPSYQDRHLSLVVPFFNEGPGVEIFHEAMAPVLRALAGWEVQIICVDDGTTDDPWARLLALAAQHAIYKVIDLSQNFGKEAALPAGLDAASGQIVVTMDADLQDPPSLI